ncbi:MAG: hypothetical protein IKZ34_02365 [Alphaproteobacteria bacterium]|nr:hypothetical protein [Alphaproteobacteria bacterium]
MKLLSKVLLNCSIFALLPVVASATGTYYTGAYQSPQTRYSQQGYGQQRMKSSYSQQGMSSYNRSQYANAGYSNFTRNSQYQQTRYGQPQQQAKQTQQKTNNNAVEVAGNGFTLGAGISRKTGMWQFEMKNSESILHYDNIDWNVFDVNANYVFGGNTKFQASAGFQYGMQAGETTMVDDDLSNGGYFISELVDLDGNVVGKQVGRAFSIGTSKSGSMMGFNAGIGLKDFMTWGKLKVTPSVGWRYLSYTLETTNNHGMSMESFDGEHSCYVVEGSDELQCDPLIGWYTFNGSGQITDSAYLVRDENGLISVPAGYIDLGGNYYYAQPGVSHKYEVEWSGPYVALEMLYDINQNNSVDAYVELGLPSYTATGDQPYRFDWQHPKSVEDSTGIAGAFHLGLGANYTTSLTDSVALTFGVTYDHYSVSGADAKTFLNGDYYAGIYEEIWNTGNYATEEEMLENNSVASDIKKIEEECPGWVCTANSEIESFYKSLGVRVGINAKF